MTPAKATGILSIIAGFVSLICTISIIPIIFTAPIGLMTGGIAIYKGHKLLGSIGVGISLLAVLIAVTLLWHGGWFSGN